MLGARFAFHRHDRVLPKLVARNKRNGKVSECIKGCDLLAAKLFLSSCCFPPDRNPTPDVATISGRQMTEPSPAGPSQE
jgi:hypothetical protein